MRLSSVRPAFIHRLLLGALLLAQLGLLQAAALGPLKVHSALGQKLDADIEIVALSAVEASALAVKLAPAEAFAEAGLDFTPLVRSLRFAIEKKAERYVVHVSSELVINDPFITLLFELNANGSRTMRQYALLLDPPELNDKAVAQTEPQLATNAEAATAAVKTKPAETEPLAPLASAPAKTSHLVKRGETLGRIAAQVRTEGMKLEQVLVALQRANPDAFVGKNMNRIKTGSVLSVPMADEIKAVDAAAARQLVLAQTADFDRYRDALARQEAVPASRATPPGTSPAAADSSNRSTSGKVGVQVTEPNASRAPADKLQLSAAGAATANLDKIAGEKALAEANQRIASLEKNISDMQQLLELKNKSLADLQNRPLPATVPAPAAPVPAAPAAPAPAASVEQTPSAEPAPLPPPAPAPSPKPALIKPPVKPAVSPAAPENSMTDWLQNPLALPAGGLLLALLLGGLLHLRRRARLRHADATGEFAEPVLESQSVFGAAGGRNIDTSNSVFHSNFVPSVSQLDTNEVDAVAEADVYIAYGRDEQAEEILLDALRLHPERNALRVKLLEIYSTRKDKQKFGKLAADLHAITGGSGDEWTQVALLGQSLDPANLLYGPAKRAEVRAERPAQNRTDAALTLVESKAPVSDVLDFDHKLEGLLAARKHGESVVSQSVPAAKDAGISLSGIDFAPEPVSLAIDEPAMTALHSKFDLAMACQEIGDLDGARELLAEVAGSRHPDLSQKAKSLLKQLA